MYYVLVFGSLLAAAALAGYGSEKDIKYSSLYDYYGQNERVKASRNEYGGFKKDFNRIGSWAFIVGIFVGALVLEFLVQPWVFVTGVAALIGIWVWRNGHANAAWVDMQSTRANRQIPLMQHWHDTGMFTDPWGYLGAFQTRYPSRKFYRMFAWVYSTKENEVEAQAEVQGKLMEIARGPKESWFPK